MFIHLRSSMRACTETLVVHLSFITLMLDAGCSFASTRIYKKMTLKSLCVLIVVAYVVVVVVVVIVVVVVVVVVTDVGCRPTIHQ